MAKTKVAETPAAGQPIPLTPNARASIDADTLCLELNNIARCADLLSDFHQDDGTGIPISGETKEWLRGILYDWIRDTAGDLTDRADRVLKFLNEQPETEAAR